MKNILIIDSEKAITRVLSKILAEENSNYMIDCVNSCEEAMEKILSNNYDLIMTEIDVWDLHLNPTGVVISYFEGVATKPNRPSYLVSEWRNLVTLFSCPVIFISGRGNLKEAVKIMRAGAFDYISKPADLGHFLNSAREALQ